MIRTSVLNFSALSAFLAVGSDFPFPCGKPSFETASSPLALAISNRISAYLLQKCFNSRYLSFEIPYSSRLSGLSLIIAPFFHFHAARQRANIAILPLACRAKMFADVFIN